MMTKKKLNYLEGCILVALIVSCKYFFIAVACHDLHPRALLPLPYSPLQAWGQVVTVRAFGARPRKFGSPSNHADNFYPSPSSWRLPTCCTELHLNPCFSDFGQEEHRERGGAHGPSISYQYQLLKIKFTSVTNGLGIVQDTHPPKSLQGARGNA